MLCCGGDCITECWEIQVDCVERANWSAVMVHSWRQLIPDRPSSVPLCTPKFDLEDTSLAAAVLLLQICQLQTCNTSFNICCFFALCVYYGIKWLYILSINIIFVNGTSGCINPSLIFKLWWEWPTGGWNTSSTLQVTLWKFQL